MAIEVISGLGPLSLEPAGLISAGRVPFPVEIYASPLLDLTQAVSGVEIIPAKPGYIPTTRTVGGVFWVIENVTGTQTTPPTLRAGSNAARTNFIIQVSTTPANADVNGANPPSLSNAAAAVATTTVQLFPNTPVYLDIVAPAAGTGGYKCMAKIISIITWMAVRS